MTLTYTELAKAAGISPSYACQLLTGERKPSATMAAKIYGKTGLKMGLFASLSDADAEVAARIHGEQSC